MDEHETAAGATATDELRLADNPAEKRYEAHVGARLAGFSEYVVAPGRLIFTHTVVDPQLEGQGIGSKLVKFELDDVRRRGLKLTPRCPFVRAYIARHRDYQDLVSQ